MLDSRLFVCISGLVAAISLSAGEVERIGFWFGTSSMEPGFIRVTKANVFDSSIGFGFEKTTGLELGEHAVTSDLPFYFSVKLPEGNYRVRLRLGGDALASSTTVKAEARRLMLESIVTQANEVVTRDFLVNIRTPHIGAGVSVRLKDREIDTEWVTWDDRLTLEFNGAHIAVSSVVIIPAPTESTVFIAGDSTVCDQALNPWNSWGQMLTRFLKPGVSVANYAQSGESVRSSLGSRRFEKIFSLMKPGDWLLMQFGHNDMKDRSPDALATYRSNLREIIAQTREIGAEPILITSMERKSGVEMPTLGEYPDAVREVAKNEGVPLIDLNVKSVAFYQALGGDINQAFQDGTHHNNYGSYELAKCVALGIEESGIRLAEYLVPDVTAFDPSKPDAFDTVQIATSPMWSRKKPEGQEVLD